MFFIYFQFNKRNLTYREPGLELKKYLPMIVCGFGAGVLTIEPLVVGFTVFLIIPFAVIAAMLLDQKANNNSNKITPGKAIFTGIFTGIFAAIFGTFFNTVLIFVTRTSDVNKSIAEVKKYLSSFPTTEIADEVIRTMSSMAYEINQYGFSFLYTFSMFTSSLVINSLFGLLGGLIGMQFINRKNEINT